MTTDDAAIRVFLLDDHEVVRRGIANLLETAEDIVVIGEAGTAAEAMARIPASRPHVAVLDARLPDGSGIDVCRDIRSSNPEISCVILTSYDDEEALFAALQSEADVVRDRDVEATREGYKYRLRELQEPAE